MHWRLSEWGRLPIGENGLTRSHAVALLKAARAHPLARGEGANILWEQNGALRTGQTVGVLAAPGCSLEILPKIDGDDAKVHARLIEMLAIALDVDLEPGETASMVRKATSLLDLLIRVFAERLLAQVRHGLPRAYLGQDDDLNVLRGRLDVQRQFTANAVRPDRLACRYDVLSTDTPLLRLMKACVRYVTPYARGAETRRLLDTLRILLSDVSDTPPPASAIRIDRTNARWQTLLRLARWLMGEDWQDVRGGRDAPEGLSLLFPMNDLFEGYVAALARRALAPLQVSVIAQGGGRHCLAQVDGTGRGGLFATFPDLILKRDGRSIAIVDTKWKRISADPADAKHGIAQGDVYQMMAYARLYDVPRLLLLYPLHRSLAAPVRRSFRINPDGARLDIATVDVGAHRTAIMAELADLLAEVKLARAA